MKIDFQSRRRMVMFHGTFGLTGFYLGLMYYQDTCLQKIMALENSSLANDLKQRKKRNEKVHESGLTFSNDTSQSIARCCSCPCFLPHAHVRTTKILEITQPQPARTGRSNKQLNATRRSRPPPRIHAMRVQFLLVPAQLRRRPPMQATCCGKRSRGAPSRKSVQ